MFPPRNVVRLRRHHSTTKAFVWQCPDLCTNFSTILHSFAAIWDFRGDFGQFSAANAPDSPAQNTKLCSKSPKKIPPNTKTTKTFFSKPGICAKKPCPGGSAGHVVPKMCSKKSAAHRSGLPPMGTSPTLTRSAWDRFSHRIARGRCGWSRGSHTRGRGRSGTWSR